MSDLRSVLTDIYRQRDELTPQVVVDEARDDEHPLHHRFEWDDSVAGEAYRRVQAAELIRSVKIVFKQGTGGEKRSVRAFSSLQESVEPERKGYVPTEELLESPLTTKILLRQLERDLSTLKSKYGHLQEFAALVQKAAS